VRDINHAGLGMSAVSAFMESFQHSPWGFIAIVLSIIGIVMAAPTFIEMFWGRPQIKVTLSQNVRAQKEGLAIGMHIQNEPIKSKFLDMLGVNRRTAEDLTCWYEIRDKHSNIEVVQQFSPVIENGNDRATARINLAASPLQAFAMLGAVMGKKFYFGDEDNPGQVAQCGDYVVTVTVLYGHKSQTYTHTLSVRDAEPYAFWQSS
jgi:hypothetical protein